MDADGGGPKNLTNNCLDDYSPSWSPDSEHIVFSSDKARNLEIYVMDADGQNQQNLTKNPYDAAPEWFGPAFVVAPTGKKLMMWGWLK